MNHRRGGATVLFSILFGLASAMAIGCSVSVDKNKDGDDKNVKIDTPLGGVHVNTDTANAADFGLPAYPGAQVESSKDGDKPADVHVGFGDWQFRIKVVKYRTSDQPDKVLAFYRKGLGRYGDVIQCNGSKAAAGTPAVTHEGLTCSDSENEHQVKMDLSEALKAGSKHHQHIVGIEKSDPAGTVFSLVEIDLPAAIDSNKDETN